MDNQKWKTRYDTVFQQLEEDKNTWNQERLALQNEIENLQIENKKYLDMIVKHTKNQTNLAIQNDAPAHVPAQNQPPTQPRQTKPKSEQKIIIQSQESPKKINFVNLPNLTENIGKTNPRILTLKQLKELFDDMFAQKNKAKAKGSEGQGSRETMEQYMYIYLNTKYGLKNLSVEWACSILNGIRKFAAKDNDVALFGLVLKNECDEEFKIVQNQVKTTVKELLKMYLKGKYPLKNNNVINKMFENRINKNVSEDECLDIVKYMYNEEDSEEIIQKLNALYFVEDNKNNQNSSEDISEKDRSKNRVSFLLFEKVILDFQLKSHQVFLSKFIDLFKSSCGAKNGILTREELSNLLKKIDSDGAFQINTEKIVQLADPHGSDSIIFSVAVSILSSETISHDNKPKSLLQLINDTFQITIFIDVYKQLQKKILIQVCLLLINKFSKQGPVKRSK